MGDLNFNQRCVTWHENAEGVIYPLVAGHRETETVGGKQDRLQAQKMMDLCDKHSLLQNVMSPTHGIEILDLIFTNNCDLISGITTEDWKEFSDHKFVNASTTYRLSAEKETEEQRFL